MIKNKFKFRRVPFIEQMQQTECGLCCIAMVSAYYKNYVSLHEIREYTGNGRDGITLFHLRNLGTRLGFETNCYKLNLNQLEKIQLPAIILWENKHFVVLEKLTKKKFRIVDPAIGRRALPLTQFENFYSGYILSLVPGEQFKQKKKEKIWRPFIKILLEKPKLIVYILSVSLILQLFTLGMPLLIQFVIDGIIMPRNENLLNVFLIGFSLLVIFQSIFTYVRGKWLINLHNYLDRKMMSDFFKQILRLPYQFFQLRSFGDLLFRANSLRIIRDIFSNQLVTGILDIGLLIVMFLYMISKSFLMTGLVLSITGINIFVLLYSRPRISEANQKEVMNHSKVQGTQTEILYGIFNVKTTGTENIMYEKWSNQFNSLIGAYRRKETILNYFNTFTGALTLLAPLSILWIGSQQIFNDYLSLGELIAFHALSTQFFGSSSSIIQTWNSVILSRSYLSRLLDIHKSPIEYTSKNPVVLKELKGAVDLKNVSFSYSKYSPSVIKNVSIQIKPGQKVALVGMSGSGKSTLARLILGLYQPTKGSIIYDNYNLNQLDKQSLRKQTGVVPQDITLFNQSIYENITLHKPLATMDEVIEAAKIAQIHDEIMQMPMKYNTIISEMGMNISGGQRQRIALARALVHKPSILVLDEATSSLDHVNEEKIDNYLKEMKCTRIVIAHRLTTIMNADYIVVLDEGEIVEQGKHEDLINLHGYYCDFFDKFQNTKPVK